MQSPFVNYIAQAPGSGTLDVVSPEPASAD